jgi:hypothetical protein
MLFGTTLAATAIGAFFAIATRDAGAPVAYAVRGFEVPVALPLAVTGFVLARRLPGNPIGWLQLTAGLVVAFLFVADGYAIAAVHAGWDLPGRGLRGMVRQLALGPPPEPRRVLRRAALP